MSNDVTVLTTCHPAYGKYLGRCMNGVLNQREKPVKHLISMDVNSSGDPTWQMNEMLDAVRTEWVAQCAADDEWLSTHLDLLLRRVAAVRDDDPSRVIHVAYSACATPGAYLPHINRPFDPDKPDEIQEYNWIPASGIIRTETLKELAGWTPHPQSGGHEDWQLWKKIHALYGSEAFVYEPTPTWLYHHHGENKSALRAMGNR